MQTNSNPNSIPVTKATSDPVAAVEEAIPPLVSQIKTNMRRFLLQVSPLERRTGPSLLHKMNEIRETLETLSALTRDQCAHNLGDTHPGRLIAQ